MKYLSLIILLGVIVLLTNSYFNIVPVTDDQSRGTVQENDISLNDAPLISDLADVQIITASFLPSFLSSSDRNPPDAFISDINSFSPKNVLSYIKEQCYTAGVDFNFAVSLLQEENLSFFYLLEGYDYHETAYEALGNNENGFSCYGLWQLNGDSLWERYIPNYWHYLCEFDWMNPYHNTYIAIRHIRYLYTSLARHHNEKGIPQLANSIYWETAMAYNSGLDNVQSGSVSNKTLDYATRIFERVKY